jgi:N-acetylglucosaminyldiphosphoundecaprenol N-acetyl-beta-D-mannosaminyltransferase
VGASLDFITGKQKRAPRWMQKTGMEWFWRMSGSPVRLVSRYYQDFLFLCMAAWQQASAQRRRKGIIGKVIVPPEGAAQPDVAVTHVEWRGALQKDALDGAPVPKSISTPVFLDTSRVTFMDSSGFGRLAMLLRHCREADQGLVVVNPSQVFRRSVRALRMDGLFQTVDSEAEALQWVHDHEARGGMSEAAKDGVVWVSFNRALDAPYYDEMMSLLENVMEHSAGIRVLVVDLTEVGFIDSRAVGGLIRAWKRMSAKGGEMFYSGAKPAVREIIALLRLDLIFTEWKGDHRG